MSFWENPTVYEDQSWNQDTPKEYNDAGTSLWEWEYSEKTPSSQDEILDNLQMFQEAAQDEDIAWFEVFQTFLLNTATDEQKQKFLDPDIQMDLYTTISESKQFPVNAFEFEQIYLASQSSQKDSEKTQISQQRTTEERKEEVESIDQTNTKIAEANTFIQSKNDFKDVIQDMPLSRNLKSLLETDISLLENVSDDNSENMSQVLEAKSEEIQKAIEYGERLIAELSQSREIEKTILPQAKASGNYEAVKNKLIALWWWKDGVWGVFEQRILAWEVWEKYEYEDLPTQQQIQTTTALGANAHEMQTQVEQSWNIFSLETSDGFGIDYDVVTNARTLQLWEYTLPSDVEDTWDYQTPKITYMKIEQENSPYLTRIERSVSAIQEKQLDDGDLAEIKATLKTTLWDSYTDWNIDSCDTTEDIRETIWIAYKQHQENITFAKDTYMQEVQSLQNTYKKALEQQDRTTKKTLQFLHYIWVDNIPQSILDATIDRINSDIGLRTALWLTGWEIDLAHGELGFEGMVGKEGIDDVNNRVIFAEMINKMIWTWPDGLPLINILNVRDGKHALSFNGTTSKTREQELIRNSWILTWWAGIAIANLKKQSSQNDG